MKPDSAASYLFSALRAKFFAPKHIELELDKHKSECLFKSRLFHEIHNKALQNE